MLAELLGRAAAARAAEVPPEQGQRTTGMDEAVRPEPERQAEDGGVALSEIVDRRVATISVGRLGRPAEIAAAALWLGDLRTATPLTVAVNGGDTFF